MVTNLIFMATEKQEEMFTFIKEFFVKHSIPPRLKELQNKFQITNKAVLDRLESLEKEGFIFMPEGVLSMQIVKKYKNDIFISYSFEDMDVAEKIYQYFADEGFHVWKDNLKINGGDKFVSEIFDNIRDSKCFIVLLSKNSINSKFVREEVSCAKGWQIKNGQPMIVPVKIADDFKDTDIFSELSHLHYMKIMDVKDENALMNLANRVHTVAYEHYLEGQEDVVKKTSKGFQKLKKDAYTDMEEYVKKNPLPSGIKEYPYREVLLRPLENVENSALNNQKLEQLMKDSIVRVAGWGGDKFPQYYYDYGEEAKFVDGAIKYVDLKPWPDREWGIAYWMIDKNLNFISRSSLREAFSSREALQNKFSTEWLVLDIVRPLLFVKKLTELTGVENWKLEYKYHGLKGLELVILSSRRAGFYRSYVCECNDINKELTLNSSVDFEQAAYDICFEILTLFQWRAPNEEMLKKDVHQLFEGKFPD